MVKTKWYNQYDLIFATKIWSQMLRNQRNSEKNRPSTSQTRTEDLVQTFNFEGTIIAVGKLLFP